MPATCLGAGEHGGRLSDPTTGSLDVLAGVDGDRAIPEICEVVARFGRRRMPAVGQCGLDRRGVVHSTFTRSGGGPKIIRVFAE